MKTIPEAAKLLDSLKSLQDKGHKFPCPRCGHDRMEAKAVDNGLSRYAEVYICNACGMNEAMMDMAGTNLPLNEWSFVKSFDKEDGVTAEIQSARGFYIGDICYVLDEELYHQFWGKKHGFKDGCFTDPKTGFSFAVAGTAYGDGCYEDNHGNCYGVDAGVIGLVPLELVKTADPDSDGTVIREPGTAHFEATDGDFLIVTPGGSTYEIDTSDDSSDDEEEEDW